MRGMAKDGGVPIQRISRKFLAMGSLSAVLWWPRDEMTGTELLLTILRYYAMARENGAL